MIWQSPLHLDKYQYARTNPHIIRLIGLLGLFSTVLMGLGFWNFFQINKIYLIIFGPLLFIFLINKILRYILQLFYQKFDIKKHEKFVNDFWLKNPEPSVDIFLPFAGEDLNVHEKVVHAVSLLNYKNYKVYMLDDAGDPSHKQLAEKYGFNYLSRPNKGEYKKSGNLEYGYARSTGAFIFILDADFIPTADSLRDLVPYIKTDEKIGILQTPQFFEQTDNVHKRSKIEFGGGNIVEEFYRIVMPCRDEFKAAMCVGTSALYRRTTILKLEGTPKVHASEDLATGLLITQHGYYVKYLPLIVSMGTSPETYQGYFKQHQRWCSGNLVFAKYWPKANLNLMARLIYLINPLYYLSEASSVLFSFQFFVLLYFHADSLAFTNSFYFIPYIILSRIIVPSIKANKNKTGTKLAALNNAYTYLYTYIQMIIKGVPAWHPTGVKISGLHNDFLNAFNLGSFLSAVHILLFIFVLYSKPALLGNYHTYLVIGWGFYNTVWHAMYLYSVAKFVHPFSLKQSTNNFRKYVVHAKTHIMPALLLLLLGSLALDSLEAIKTPNTPTALAINNLKNNPDQVKLSLFIEPTVAGASTSIYNSNAYTFKYNYGDTIVSLAQTAVQNYISEQNIQMDSESITLVSQLIADNFNTTHKINYGDEIIFSKSEISQAVDASMFKASTQ